MNISIRQQHDRFFELLASFSVYTLPRASFSLTIFIFSCFDRYAGFL